MKTIKMEKKMLELITLINQIKDSKFREKMIIHLIKLNKSSTEMEFLFKNIQRRLNE